MSRLDVVNDYFLFGIQVGVRIWNLSCLKNLNVLTRVKLNWNMILKHEIWIRFCFILNWILFHFKIRFGYNKVKAMEELDPFLLELILPVYWKSDWNVAFSILLIKDRSFSRIYSFYFKVFEWSSSITSSFLGYHIFSLINLKAML